MNSGMRSDEIEGLCDGKHTIKQISEAISLNYSDTAGYLRTMHKARRVYIESWANDAKGKPQHRMFRRCETGNEVDAPPPHAKTRSGEPRPPAPGADLAAVWR